MIEYDVRLADLNRHLFEVRCHIPNPNQEQTFSIPSWIPGSYLLREFARHIVSICAENEHGLVEVEKLSKNTWVCRNSGSRLTVTIEVFAFDSSVRGAFLDGKRGFFNGTCLFLSVGGREHEPSQVRLVKSKDPRCKDWRAATAMSPGNIDVAGFGTYEVANYDELIDHPVEMSEYSDTHFDASEVPHRLVIAGFHHTEKKRIAKDLKHLCEAHINLFGAPPPFKNYLFLGLAVGNGYGGLEHRASSSLVFCRDDLPKKGQTGISKGYQRFLSLCSHEYFHAWNMKCIKPKAFTPYRLDQRAHTRLMWVFEGITSYYQDLMLLRSKLINPDEYLVRLGKLLTRVYRSPGRFTQSLSDASFDAWDKLYKPNANSTNATISYYSKGALVALALDLTVRKGSSSTLDQIMQVFWQRFGKNEIGVAEDEFENLSQEISGLNLDDFFNVSIRWTKDFPLRELMKEFAVDLQFRQGRYGDASGLPRKETNQRLDLGFRTNPSTKGLDLTEVIHDGPSERAGLNPGDVLIALGGLRVDQSSLPKQLERFNAGETVSVTVFRDDELKEFMVTLAEAIEDTCVLSFNEQSEDDALHLRKAWIGK